MDERVLNELLECSVCLDRLELSSKVLPCQHTFCRRCLEEIVSTKHELRCPECRSLVEIPIEDLPPNILLIRLLEGMKHAGRIAASITLSGQGNNGGGRVSVAPTNATAGAGCHVRAARCSPKTVSTSQPCAKAIYNYDAKEPGDLSFCKGDVVLLRKQVDENWYHGELNGHQGFFPATYVQVITPLPQEIPKCRALYDFVVTDSNEKDCLAFHRDDELTVIRRVDNNWAEGKLVDRIGIFPISFVEMNDAAKWLVNAHFHQSSQSRAAPATCSAIAPPRLVVPIATTAPTFTPSGAVKTVAPPANPNVLLAQQGSQQKRHSMTALPSSPHCTMAPEQHRHSMEIPSGHEVTMAAVAGSDSTAVTLAPRTISKVTSAVSQTRTTAGTVSYTATPPTFYVALYNYKPQKTDEVELRKGDYYTVTEKCQDGWFKGTCLRSGSVGVFPGNYVQAVKINSASKSAVSMATVTTAGGASFESSSSAGTGVVTSVSRTTPSCTPHVGRAPAVPPHATVGRTHSFPKTSPRVSAGGVSGTTSGQCVTKIPNVTVTHTRTITNVTQAVTRSLMSACQQSRPLTHGGDVTGVTTVSHASTQVQQITKHGDTSGNGDKNRGRGSPHVSSRSAEKATKHSTSSSTSANHHHHHHQGQGHSGSAAAASSAHHSMSASVVVTPPNVVVGATSPSNHVVTTTTSKDKKERRDKDVGRLGIMKRLTKNKKSKSPPPDLATDDPVGHPPVPHRRSGSLPVETQGATAGISALQNKKSVSLDTSHQQTSSSRPGKPKPLVRERYRCIAPYPPQSDIELELKVGDIVYIHKKREDGWYKGTQQRTGKTGLFPGSFVKNF